MKTFPFFLFLCLFSLTSQAQNLSFVQVNTVDEWEKFTEIARGNHMSLLLTIDRGFNVSTSGTGDFYKSKCLALETKSTSELGRKMTDYFRLNRGAQALWFRADEWLMYKSPNENWDQFENWSNEAAYRISQYSQWGKSAEGKQLISHDNWFKLLEITSYNDMLGFEHLNALYLSTWNDSTIINLEVQEYVIEFGTDIKGPIFEQVELNFDVLHQNSFRMGEFLGMALERNLNRAIYTNDSSLAEAIQNKLYPLQKKFSSETDTSYTLLLWAQYFEGVGQWDNWEKFADEYIMRIKSPNQSLEWSSKILELYGADQVSLQYAEKWLEAVSGANNFDVEYLLAQVYYRLGKIRPALDAAYRAESLASTGEQAQAAKNLQYYFSY